MSKKPKKANPLEVVYYYSIANFQGVIEQWLNKNKIYKTFGEVLFDLGFAKTEVVGISKVEYCSDFSDNKKPKDWRQININDKEILSSPLCSNIRITISTGIEYKLGSERIAYDAARGIIHPTHYVLEMSDDGSICLHGYESDKLISEKKAQISGAGPNQHITITSGEPVFINHYHLARRSPECQHQCVIGVKKADYITSIEMCGPNEIQIANERELRNYLENIQFPTNLDKVYADVMAISFKDTSNYTSIGFYYYYNGAQKGSKFWISDEKGKSTNVRKLTGPNN